MSSPRSRLTVLEPALLQLVEVCLLHSLTPPVSSEYGCLLEQILVTHQYNQYMVLERKPCSQTIDATGTLTIISQRANVPQSIQQATTSSAMDISSWGNPSAAYPSSSCNIGQYFGSQKLVVDITLCGDW